MTVCKHHYGAAGVVLQPLGRVRFSWIRRQRPGNSKTEIAHAYVFRITPSESQSVSVRPSYPAAAAYAASFACSVLA